MPRSASYWNVWTEYNTCEHQSKMAKSMIGYLFVKEKKGTVCMYVIQMMAQITSYH